MRFALILIALTALAAWGQAVYKIGDGVSAPVPIFKVEPAYTEEAQGRKVEGRVLIKLVIDEKGIPGSIEVLRWTPSSAKDDPDYGLKGKAVEAVARWRFKPGMKEGKPVKVRANVEVNFRLQDKPAQEPGNARP